MGAPKGNHQMKDPSTYAVYLWIFTVLLFARVVGQLIVNAYAPQWLPPMEQWQSGLLPYRRLLFGQAIVLTLMIWISTDFSRGSGFWVRPHRDLGIAAVWWSWPTTFSDIQSAPGDSHPS
jgi:hypothetical protein